MDHVYMSYLGLISSRSRSGGHGRLGMVINVWTGWRDFKTFESVVEHCIALAFVYGREYTHTDIVRVNS